MAKYLILLGKTRLLCQHEIEQLFAMDNIPVEFVEPHFALIETDNQNIIQTAEKSGGIVKIAKIIEPKNRTIANEIAAALEQSGAKAFFSVISQDVAMNRQVKDILSDQGIKSRYTESNDLYATAVGLDKSYQEFWDVELSSQKILAQVIWMQNIKEWAKRDFARPKSDPKSGMLPPKIARIMINLATSSENNQTIYDPFCGSGTILAEALARGFGAVGSDISAKAIDDTRQNLQWLKSVLPQSNGAQVFLADATHVKAGDFTVRPTAIVFEPYMGPPNLHTDKIKNIAKGLEKLYIGTVKNLSLLQQKGERLVGIFPSFDLGNSVKNTDSFIDRCENFGYTRKIGPLEYKRPHATVIRRIYVLERR